MLNYFVGFLLLFSVLENKEEILLETGPMWKHSFFNANINQSGDLIVSSAKEIYHFSKNGKLLKTIRSTGGEGPGSFSGPCYVQFDGDRYYIYSAFGGRLVVLDQNMEFLFEIHQLAVNIDLIDNKLFVRENGLDSENNYCIYKLDTLGPESTPNKTFWPITQKRQEVYKQNQGYFHEGSIISLPQNLFAISEVVYPRIYILDSSYAVLKWFDVQIENYKFIDKISSDRRPTKQGFSYFVKILNCESEQGICFLAANHRKGEDGTFSERDQIVQIIDMNGKPKSKPKHVNPDGMIIGDGKNVFCLYEQDETPEGVPIYALQTVF